MHPLTNWPAATSFAFCGFQIYFSAFFPSPHFTISHFFQPAAKHTGLTVLEHELFLSLFETKFNFICRWVTQNFFEMSGLLFQLVATLCLSAGLWTESVLVPYILIQNVLVANVPVIDFQSKKKVISWHWKPTPSSTGWGVALGRGYQIWNGDSLLGKHHKKAQRKKRFFKEPQNCFHRPIKSRRVKKGGRACPE